MFLRLILGLGDLFVMGIVVGSTLVVFTCCLVECDGFAGL